VAAGFFGGRTVRGMASNFWTSGRVIAKNYLTDVELAQLSRLVNAYLDVAEDMAQRKIPVTMQDWETRLNRFIEATDREVLQDAGKVSAEIDLAPEKRTAWLMDKNQFKENAMSETKRRAKIPGIPKASLENWGKLIARQQAHLGASNCAIQVHCCHSN